MAVEEDRSGTEARSFLACAAEVARLLGIEDTAPVPEEPEERRARYLAHAVRKPLLERAVLPEDAFAALMAAAVHDPDPSFCRWFVEPALYVFGRRRVLAALVDRMRTGSDAERAGAVRAWYCAHLPLSADRSPAYAPGGSRDPALDECRDVVDSWLEESMRVFARSTDPQTRLRVLLNLPAARAAYPQHLHELLDHTIVSARTHPSEHIRRWGAVAERHGA
ncbi:hypothetical protein ACGF8B_05795 [Streptomyces sp. NPDC047917]|uniref:hypothetical protein n=1 Tax=Streptomyces sp. NPDC047917 TaxID=3365491 RepID=UPI00372301F4